MEDDTCVLVLDNVTSADSGGLNTWTCDQGQGEVTVYLTVTSQGTLMWSTGGKGKIEENWVNSSDKPLIYLLM